MKIGILGFGRLGQISARIGSNLAKGINVFDIDEKRNQEAGRLGYQVCLSEGDLFSKSDAVLMHLSVLQNRAPVVTSKVLSKNTALITLVNTSRGTLVDEGAVIEALRTGTLGFYCADVLSFEDTGGSLKSSPIWEELAAGGNVMLTPHIGGASLDAIASVESYLFTKLLERLDIGVDSQA